MSGFNVDLWVTTRSLPEHRLISAVIVHAMRDACLPPIMSMDKKIRMSYHAMTAHDFLWLDGLENYIHYLDIEASYFRKGLIKAMANDRAEKIGEFTSENRRAFRINKKLWDAVYNGQGPVTQDWSTDEKD